MAWEVEFYDEEGGRCPVREFLADLEPEKRMAMIAAIEVVLVPRGLAVCETEYGRQLGDGLFEFRVRHDEQTTLAKAGRESSGDQARRRGDVLLRLFCHAYGEKIVLLLGGYDKGADPSGRRQSREIETARSDCARSACVASARNQRRNIALERCGLRVWLMVVSRPPDDGIYYIKPQRSQP